MILMNIVERSYQLDLKYIYAKRQSRPFRYDRALCKSGKREVLFYPSAASDGSFFDRALQCWGTQCGLCFCDHVFSSAAYFHSGDDDRQKKRGHRKLSRASFMKTFILSMRVLPSCPNHLSKVPPLHTITSGMRFQPMNLVIHNSALNCFTVIYALKLFISIISVWRKHHIASC